jgi:hypothetical protein
MTLRHEQEDFFIFFIFEKFVSAVFILLRGHRQKVKRFHEEVRVIAVNIMPAPDGYHLTIRN